MLKKIGWENRNDAKSKLKYGARMALQGTA